MTNEEIKNRIEEIKNMVLKDYVRGVSGDEVRAIAEYLNEPFTGKVGCGGCIMQYFRKLINKNII